MLTKAQRHALLSVQYDGVRGDRATLYALGNLGLVDIDWVCDPPVVLTTAGQRAVYNLHIAHGKAPPPQLNEYQFTTQYEETYYHPYRNTVTVTVPLGVAYELELIR